MNNTASTLSANCPICKVIPAVAKDVPRCEECTKLFNIESLVLAAYERCKYRVSQSNWAGGNHNTIVLFGEPSAKGQSFRVWSKNGKWTGTDSQHLLTVSKNWDQIPEDARVVSSLLTLSLVVTEEEGIYEASWIEQSRGVAIIRKSGYLVLGPDGWVHSDTLIGARKKKTSSKVKVVVDLSTFSSLQLLKRARCTGDESISFDTARHAGHCDAGIRDWIAKAGIVGDSITSKELAEIAVRSGDRVKDVYMVLLACKRMSRAA